MAEITEPFASPDDLRDRWAAIPDISDTRLEIILLDASQYIVDVCDAAESASDATLRRITCSVARRSIEAENSVIGVESIQQGAGPYQETIRPVNPHGDFYLTRQERKALNKHKKRVVFVDLLAERDE